MINANYIEFYFDCSSPWTYLAFVEILSLSQRHNLEIDWKPILVGGVFNTVNQDVYEFRKKPNPLKLNYSTNDLYLWSRVREISISFPEVFPVNSVKAMRGCIFAHQENKLEQFAKLVFHAYWTLGRDISKEDVLLKIAQNANLNEEKFKNFIHSDQARRILTENTKELISRGGFGSPTFFYNNQMFFGNDRIALFEESLKIGLLD
ncbi:2-hydroxychromene-2-carboxylate isomerase [Gammaproteobacteria bacterium]|nr:2-hydroxychromene-2-carboxylate isomerase [Gammaproteobacteria bacterium]MDA8798908.1 2-hydroxychromene-2-carboxylate isomerase [Gammaproteobacteria bacterium]MDC0919397.1 2-hydroxychromene-2-carboxylate isomerase [Gammaproteobacteria bacterium]